MMFIFSMHVHSILLDDTQANSLTYCLSPLSYSKGREESLEWRLLENITKAVEQSLTPLLFDHSQKRFTNSHSMAHIYYIQSYNKRSIIFNILFFDYSHMILRGIERIILKECYEKLTKTLSIY